MMKDIADCQLIKVLSDGLSKCFFLPSFGYDGCWMKDILI